MGDGRYYTTYQYARVIYLTLLISIMVSGIMIYFYRHKGHKIHDGFIVMHISLIIIAIISFLNKSWLIYRRLFFVAGLSVAFIYLFIICILVK